MPIYVKKPIAIEAVEFKVIKETPCKFGINKEHNGTEICKFMALPMLNTHFDSKGAYINIETLEGVMRTDVGDFIIKGVNGEFYPCKPDIFSKTYFTQDEYAELQG
tara:strand:- start:91 stop:408 length:318 start_codon:yes stop_codon:yes gene_type:complete